MSKKLAQMICGNCSIGLLYQDEKLHKWLRCEFCGFCILKIENEKRE